MTYTRLYLSLLLCCYACTTNNKLEKALQLAGNNRPELEKVLTYYRNDSLKLAAAHFLIENMRYHIASAGQFISPSGEIYSLDITLFPDHETVQKHCDSLIHTGYRIDKSKQKDIETVSSQFLIENIELAFEVWNKPWNKEVSFTSFCNYILPYRAQKEPLSTLRKVFILKYVPVIEAAGAKTPMAACIAVNDQLRKELKYSNTGSPFYPTLEETYYSGKSQCDGLCNLGTAIMRAAGVPVAVDYTVWTKIDLGHSWCSVLDNGKFYSFGLGEDNPVKHGIKYSSGNLVPAKVYRLSFKPSFQKTKIKDDNYRSFVKSPLSEDVTTQYNARPVTIQVVADKKVDNQTSLIYLCAFNRDEWQVIAKGVRTGKECLIENVVGDNVFIVADSPNGNSLRYLTAPFYMDTTGVIRKFIPNLNTLRSFTLDKRKRKLNQPYTLSYWDNTSDNFIPITHAISGDSTQSYTNIPDNTLLRFTIPERILNQRIFFIENDILRKY